MTSTITAGGRAVFRLARLFPSCREIVKAAVVAAIWSVVVVFLHGWIGIGQATDGKAPTQTKLVEVPGWTDGRKPSFALPDLTGARHDLGTASGRLVLVHFFATWCEPCREELPALQRFLDRSGDTALAIFAISVGEPEQRVRRFFEGNPLRFPVLLDRDREVGKTWRVQSLPTTYVLDRELKPRLLVEGEFEWDRATSEQLLGAVLSVQDGR
jgi:peroxiredoxin